MSDNQAFDIAVPTFTAVFNNATGKIDLNWEAPTDELIAGSRLGSYVIAYREGNFPSSSYSEDIEDVFEKYLVEFVANVNGLAYSFTLPEPSVATYSFIVYPVFFKTGEVFGIDGRPKLLTYTIMPEIEVPLYSANDMTLDFDYNIYIRNGFKTSNTSYNLNVISKVNNFGEFSNVSVDATTDIYNSINGLSLNVADDKFYSIEDRNSSNIYTVVDKNGNLISTTPNLFISAAQQYPPTKWVLTNNLGDVFVHFSSFGTFTAGRISAIFKMFPNITTAYSSYSIPSANYTVETLPDVDGLNKYTITTNNTLGLKERQFITFDNPQINHGIVTNVIDNESFTVVTKNEISFGSDKAIYAYNYELVAGNFFSSNTTTTTFSSNYFHANVGYYASKGFILGNFYYYMRKDNNNVKHFVKLNLITGALTEIGLNTTNDYNAVTYSEHDGFAYAITNSRLVKKNIETNETTVVAGDATLTGNVDGSGSVVRFFNPVDLVSLDDKIIILDEVKTSSTLDPLYRTNILRMYDITNDIVSTINLTDEQPVEVEDETAGDGDVSSSIGGNVGLGIGNYIADIPPYNSVTPDPVTVRDPENNIIGVVPMPVGLEPDSVVTFRKNGDRLYILVNGRVIWTYRLSPIRLYNFNSTGYRGWYTIGTNNEIETPESAITYPVFDSLYYVFNGTVVEPMASTDILFTYGKNYVGQSLIVYEDGTVIVDRVIDNDDVLYSAYVVRGGRNYRIFNNQKAPSPLLPRWVVDAIVNSNLYEYLFEVEEV